MNLNSHSSFRCKQSTATVTDTTIIAATKERILANETATADESIESNDDLFLEGTFTFGSRVDYNNNNSPYTGRNHDGKPQKRDSDETITPTLWPTYAPTPFTKAPVTPIPTYSPTEVPTTVPSPPTSRPTPRPTSVSTPSPSVASITGPTATDIPTAAGQFVTKNENAPEPTWDDTPSGGGYNGQTAIPTYYWRRTNKRNLRHREDQDED